MVRSRRLGRGGFRRAIKLVIITPPSTPGCIVFPFDKVKKKFNSSNYNPAQTQGRITHAEIDRLLDEISVPVAQYNKEVTERQKLDFWLRCIGLIFLPLLLVYVCCFRADKLREALAETKKIKDTVNQIIYINGSSFAARGFAWKLPGHFPQWIELKDMSLQYQPQNFAQANLAGAQNFAIRPPGQGHQQAFPMQNGGGYFQPNVNIQMVSMQQQSYPLNNNISGSQLDNSMVSFQQSGYPVMQGGNQQQYGKGVMAPNQMQHYGQNYYG